MSYGTAIHILEHITDYEQTDILEAVEKILSMATINAVRKQALLNAVRWFWENCVEEEKT